MAAQCVGCIVAHGVTVVLAYREVGFAWPTFSSVRHALRLGWSMFLFRAAQGITGSLNGLVLGCGRSHGRAGPIRRCGTHLPRLSTRAVAGQSGSLPAIDQTDARQSPRRDEEVKAKHLLSGAASVCFSAFLSLLRSSTTGPLGGLGDAFQGVDTRAARILLMDPSHCLVHGIDIPATTAQIRLDYQFNLVILTAGLLSFGCALLLAPDFQAVRDRLGGSGRPSSIPW